MRPKEKHHSQFRAAIVAGELRLPTRSTADKASASGGLPSRMYERRLPGRICVVHFPPRLYCRIQSDALSVGPFSHDNFALELPAATLNFGFAGSAESSHWHAG